MQQALLVEELKELLDQNKSFVSEDGKTCGFCNSIDSVIKITVDPQHHHHLLSIQRITPQ